MVSLTPNGTPTNKPVNKIFIGKGGIMGKLEKKYRVCYFYDV